LNDCWRCNKEAIILQKKRAFQIGVLVAAALALVVLMVCACSPLQAVSGPTLVFFRAANCPYCKQMTPIVNDIEQKYGKQLDVTYAELEQEEGKQLARQHGVIGFPILLLLDGEGERANLFQGVVPQAVVEGAIDDLLLNEP
jgi:thiol-disulfide isomerase/thioredoxin